MAETVTYRESDQQSYDEIPADWGSALSPEFVCRLERAIEWSIECLEPFKEARRDAIDEIAGFEYGDGATEDERPVNYLELTTTTYRRLLAGGNPRVLVSTKVVLLKAEALEFEVVMDDHLERTDFAEELDLWIMEAIVSPRAIMRVGLEATETVEIDGVPEEVGISTARVIFFEDFFSDMSKQRFEQSEYMGHDYWLSIDEIKASGLFKVNLVERLVPSQRRLEGVQGGDRSEELTTGGRPIDDGQLFDQIHLRDVWLPSLGLLITLAPGQEFHEPLREMEWTGQRGGPYIALAYNKLPQNVLGPSVISHIIELHDKLNSVFRKIHRQADRTKQVTLYTDRSEADAKAVVESDDGDMVNCAYPQDIVPMISGGVNPGLLAYFMQLKDIANYFTGNIEAAAGLGPSSPTLGQDELIRDMVGRRFEMMADQTMRAVRKVMRAHAHWLWNDPVRQLSLYKSLQGTKVNIPFVFSSANHVGNFANYNIDIEPYSMQGQTPQTRVASIRAILTEIYPVIREEAIAQGVSINAEQTFRTFARLLNVNELEELMVITQPQSPEHARTPRMDVPKPATTRRVEERVNRSERTRRGSEGELSKILMSALKSGSQQGNPGTRNGA
jgi:hypothetical protein